MMAHPAPTMEEITALERPGNLLASLRALDARWNEGCHDAETARRRAFLYWWSRAEPEFLTGLPRDLDATPFTDMRDWLLAQPSMDSETRFVLGWMLTEFFWHFNSGQDFEARGRELLRHHDDELVAPRITFGGQSEYHRYFAHILSAREDGRSKA